MDTSDHTHSPHERYHDIEIHDLTGEHCDHRGNQCTERERERNYTVQYMYQLLTPYRNQGNVAVTAPSAQTIKQQRTYRKPRP